MRTTLCGLVFLFGLTATTVAQAQTTITGGNVINQTWDAAGSPYIVSGDVTVPANSTLTIAAGAVVQMVNGDKQMSGNDHGHVEFLVSGSLMVQGGPTTQPILEAQNGTAGSWYGIEVLSGGSASFTSAIVRDAITGVTSGASLSVSGLTVTNCSSTGLLLSTGSPTLDRVTAYGNGSYGVSVGSGSGPTFTRALVYNNQSYGFYLGGGTATTIDHSTIWSNGSYGVYVSVSTPATIKSSIIGRSTYGVFVGSGSATITNSDVWGDSSNNVYGGTTDATDLSANPLFVDPTNTNFRLTSNSPARFASASGDDLGPLPYVSDATPGLYGTLWTSTHLTTANSPYQIGGDLTVPPSSTLTIDAGVTLVFASNSDIMQANSDLSHGELIVQGTLAASGTSASNILIESASNTAGSWAGVEIKSSTPSAQLNYATVRDGVTDVASSAAGTTLQLRGTTLLNASSIGLLVSGGSPLLDSLTVHNNGSYGISVGNGASPSIVNSLIYGNQSYGVYAGSGLAISLYNDTIDSNGSYGVYVSVSTPLSLVNSIVTNQTYGVFVGSGSAAISYSDLWGNSSNNNYGGSLGAGSISANPQYTSAGNYHLQSSSVCIDVGTSTGAPNHDHDGTSRPLVGTGLAGAQYDLGAYEYASMQMCGDGLVEPPEACDDGKANGQYGKCNSGCTAEGPHCGDHIVNGSEQCDDGLNNGAPGDPCSASCTTVSGTTAGGTTAGGTTAGGTTTSGTTTSGTTTSGTTTSGTTTSGTTTSGTTTGGTTAGGPPDGGTPDEGATTGGTTTGTTTAGTTTAGTTTGGTTTTTTTGGSSKSGGCSMVTVRGGALSPLYLLALAALLLRRRRQPATPWAK